MNSRVLIFDSGVGGLSIMQAIRDRLPATAFQYVADNAWFPYGDLEEDRLIDRCCTLVEEMLGCFPADLVVIACNTASTLVLPHLRSRLTVPVVGVVPAIKPAAALSDNRRLGVLATPGTVKRAYLDDLITDFAADCQVTRAGSSELVRMAEAQVAGFEPDVEQVSEIVRPLAEAAVDTVVLGCTHFPLIKPVLKRCLPDVRHWVDSGDAVARRVEFLLGTAIVEPTHFFGTQGCEFHFTGPVPANLHPFLAQLGFSAAQTKTAQLSLSGF